MTERLARSTTHPHPGAVPRTPAPGVPSPRTAPGEGTAARRAPRRRQPVAPAAAPPRAPHRPRTAPEPATEPAPVAFPPGAPAPSLRIRTNALQALCRQVIGVRFAVVAVGVPFALHAAADGLPRTLVLVSAVLSLMGSYAVLRDWERVGPLLLRHPTLLGLDLFLASVLLLTASPESPLGYATVATPLLSGLLYGWRGAAVFTGVQLAVLLAVFRAWEPGTVTVSATLLIGGFCLAAGLLGVTLRNLVFRVAAAGAALAEAGERIAVAEALAAERARLAREMHDTVAKTLHGVALAADALAATEDPAAVRRDAAVVARSARRAATESRTLLAGLRRRTTDPGAPVPVDEELAALLTEHRLRTGADAALTPAHHAGLTPAPPLPPRPARDLVLIAAEALENTHRHAQARQVRVEYGVDPTGVLRLSVLDDGRGLPPGLRLDALRAAGHFGLLGMSERADALSARIHMGAGRDDHGTEIRVDLALDLLPAHWGEEPADATRP